ncbi:MAG: CAP domain-containing protein [Rubrivivax sp.]|nr:CAP domain-containing protein [Rubrivivax sp.]
MNPSKRTLGVFWLAAASSLAACGGGGDTAAPAPPTAGSPAPTPTPSPTPAPPTASPTPGPGVAGTRATCGLANFEADLMARINAQRASGASCGAEGSFPAAAALSWNAALTQASLVHSDDMMALNFFSHTGSNGSSAGQRATNAGYVWQTWGENIAAGQPTVNSVMDAWVASPGHCANLMNARFRDIGLACVSGSANNTYRSYWTMTLGTAR